MDTTLPPRFFFRNDGLDGVSSFAHAAAVASATLAPMEYPTTVTGVSSSPPNNESPSFATASAIASIP